jgi:hypothetical protein
VVDILNSALLLLDILEIILGTQKLGKNNKNLGLRVLVKQPSQEFKLIEKRSALGRVDNEKRYHVGQV